MAIHKNTLCITRINLDINRLAHVAATGAYIHAQAAKSASRGGPISAEMITAQIPGAITQLIR